MYIRKSASSLTSAEQKAFVAAVLALKAQPSSLHPGEAGRGRYDDFVEVHLNAMAVMESTPPGPSWGHMAAAFGPWHRVLLHHFESELQAIDSGVTLRYWDWITDHDPASPLWNPGFLGGDGGPGGIVPDGPFCRAGGDWPLRVLDDPAQDVPFLTRAMGQDATARSLPASPMVSSALGNLPYDSAPWEDMMRGQRQPAQWTGFRIQLEATLHNLVHRWVGGTMVAMAAPNDPVFWLHHSNIDRLWSSWIRQHQDQSPYLPHAGGPQGHNLYDAMIFHAGGNPPPWPGDSRPVDVLDHHILGYRYDTDPADEDKLPMGPVPAPGALPVTGPAGPMPPMPMTAAPMTAAAAAVTARPRRALPRFALASEIAALR
jgi:tyrosinase